MNIYFGWFLPLIAVIVYRVLRKQRHKCMYSMVYIAFAAQPYLVENTAIPYANILHKLIIIVAILQILIIELKSRKAIRVIIPPLVLLFTTIILGLFAGNITNSFYNGIVNIIYQVLLCEIVYICCVDSGNLDWLYDGFQINSVIFAACAIIEFIMTGGRSEVIFYNPNWLAVYLMCGAVLFLFKRQKKWLLWYTAIILGIICTFSTTVLVTAVILLFLPFFDQKSIDHQLNYNILTTAIMVVFIIIIINSTTIANSNNIISEIWNWLRTTKDTLRDLTWSAAIQMFKDNFLFGVGHNNYQSLMSHYGAGIQTSYSIAEYGYAAHNEYLRILAEQGIIGFIVFIIILYRAVNTAAKIPDKQKRLISMSWLLIAIVFSFTHNFLSSVTFWIALVIPYANIKITSGNHT